MSAWPQISVAAWLVISVLSATAAAVRPSRSWLVITSNQQRLAAIAFAAAAISEASLLWAGGFFERIL